MDFSVRTARLYEVEPDYAIRLVFLASVVTAPVGTLAAASTDSVGVAQATGVPAAASTGSGGGVPAASSTSSAGVARATGGVGSGKNGAEKLQARAPWPWVGTLALVWCMS